MGLNPFLHQKNHHLALISFQTQPRLSFNKFNDLSQLHTYPSGLNIDEIDFSQIPNMSQQDYNCYYVMPYELTATHLQYLFNEGLVSLSIRGWDIGKYLTFGNKSNPFPNITIEKSKVVKHTSAKETPFFEIIETGQRKFDDKTGNFTIPITVDGQEHTLIQDARYMNKLISQVNQHMSKSKQTIDIKKEYGGKKVIWDTSLEFTGKKVVIVGAPDPQRMRLYLEFEAVIDTAIELIKKNLRTQIDNMVTYISNLRTKIDINFFDMYGWLLQELKYLFPKSLSTNQEVLELKNILINKFNEKYIKKPNLKIAYIFNIFVEKSPNSNVYEPLILSIRDITTDHTDILKKVLELIQTKLPDLYGILKKK